MQDVREVFHDRSGSTPATPVQWHQHADGGLVDSRGRWRLNKAADGNWLATMQGRNGRATASSVHRTVAEAREHAGTPAGWTPSQRALHEEYEWSEHRFADHHGERPYR